LGNLLARFEPVRRSYKFDGSTISGGAAQLESPMKRAIKRLAFFTLGMSLGVAAAVVVSGCSMAAGAMEGLGVDIRAVGAASARN